ncbi:hypothetical protein I350_07040 [Cryptococcus amylolentus CBS 6273]|uniref:Uncharacterized protein n=1 Tax=Cryptococcus amylolentus CBS 6273 TaxID=1296118 RepID=A0A1E3JHN3_9TREE|nr:hypothetical protein I350_07040 [Cryptococcus amylolentus CBS 6273]
MPSLSTTLPSPIPDAPALPPADAPASTYPPTGPAVARRRSSSIKHPHPHAHPHLVVGQAAVSYPPPPRKPLTPTGYVPAFESDDEMFKERYIALQLLINELEDENNLIAYRIAKEESRMRQLGLPLPNYAFSGPPNPPPVPEVVTQGALPAEPHSAEDVPRGREGEISARGTASNGVSGMEREEPRGVLPESRRVVTFRPAKRDKETTRKRGYRPSVDIPIHAFLPSHTTFASSSSFPEKINIVANIRI